MCQRTISGEMVSLCPSMNWFVSRYAYRTGGSFQESLKERETATPRKPSARSGPGACCAPPCGRCLLRPGSRTAPRPFSPPWSAQHRSPALPLVGRRDGLPGGYGRKRDSRRTVRIRGGVVITIACAFHRASNAVPGVLVSEANEVVRETRSASRHAENLRLSSSSGELALLMSA